VFIRAAPLDDEPGEIIGRFSASGDRARFLNDLEKTVATKNYGYYGDYYAGALSSLIEALEQESPPPAAELKPENERTPEESFQAWVYELRYESQARWFPASAPLTARLKLEGAGPAALDALMAALDDPAPTQEIAFQDGPRPSVLLRRKDLALECVEYISGIQFMERTLGRSAQFQRLSPADGARAWWKLAKGKSQAEGVRIQLALWGSNLSSRERDPFNVPDEDWLLTVLLALEPSHPALERLGALNQRPHGWFDDGARVLFEIDPQTVLRGAFARSAEHHPHDGDDFLLIPYGDKRIYQQLSHRALVDSRAAMPRSNPFAAR